MIDMNALQKSKKFYEESRDFFIHKNISECVIEISDRPMSEWVIHFTKSDEDMFMMRSDLLNLKKPFIAIYKVDEGTHFFFRDAVLMNLELVESKSLIFSHIVRPIKIDKEKLKKEIQELKKLLQNS